MFFFPKNIYIYKRTSTKSQLLKAQYSSATFDFINPRVALDNDNSIWICATNNPDFGKSRTDSSLLYSFFLVRLDSNLKEVSRVAKFLKVNAPDIEKKIF
jgi:hypothetical protein